MVVSYEGNDSMLPAPSIIPTLPRAFPRSPVSYHTIMPTAMLLAWNPGFRGCLNRPSLLLSWLNFIDTHRKLTMFIVAETYRRRKPHSNFSIARFCLVNAQVHHEYGNIAEIISPNASRWNSYVPLMLFLGSKRLDCKCTLYNHTARRTWNTTIYLFTLIEIVYTYSTPENISA